MVTRTLPATIDDDERNKKSEDSNAFDFQNVVQKICMETKKHVVVRAVL